MSENKKTDSPKSNKLTKADRADFKKLDKQVRDGVTAFMESGEALMKIRDQELWRAGKFESWNSYCQQIVGLTKRHANRLISAVETSIELSQVGPKGPTLLPLLETQLRPFMKIEDPEIRLSIWESAVEDAGGQPTAKTVAAKVAEYMAENSEQPTPEKNTTKDDGEVDEEITVIEVEAESIPASTEKTDANEDPTLPPQGGENVDEEQAPAPSSNFIKKCRMIISHIRGEARRGGNTDKIISLATELEEYIMSFQ